MKKKIPYIIIIIVAIIATLPLLIKSNVWGHDTNFHIANIEDISKSITLDNPFPKISINIGNELGYGTHLFYAPLPHYIGGYLNLVFKTLGLGVDNTLVFIYIIVSILSGFIIYIYSNELTKNKYIALLSSIIFLLMPYRMGDIIIRSSLNEVFVFLFIPMILLSLNRLIHNKKFLLLFTIGYIGLILSHLVLALYTTLFIIIWALIRYKEIFTIEKLKKLSIGIILVTIFVLPFLILMLNQKTGTNYLIFLKDYMSNITYMDFYSINLKDFIIPSKDYSWDVPYFINIIVLISFFVSIYFYIKDKKKDKNILYLIILTFISAFMCLKIFPWKMLPDFLYMIQFPWRLITFITIGISIVAPLWILKLDTKKIKPVIIILAIFILATEIPFIKSMTTYKYLLNDEIDFNVGMGHSKEYLPTSTYENINYFENRDNNIVCSSCDSKIIKNNSKVLKFEINTDTEQVIEIPRIYYIGYKLTNSNKEKVKFYENDKGFIAFIGDKDTYTLKYTGTTLYKVTSYIRTITTIILISIPTYKFYKKINIVNKTKKVK